MAFLKGRAIQGLTLVLPLLFGRLVKRASPAFLSRFLRPKAWVPPDRLGKVGSASAFAFASRFFPGLPCLRLPLSISLRSSILAGFGSGWKLVFVSEGPLPATS